MKWLMTGLGLLLLLLGAFTFWLPLPIGLPLAAAGVFVLVRHSSDARRLLVKAMRRFPKLRELIQRIKNLQGRG